MNRRLKLDALRRRIGEAERFAPKVRAGVSFGAEALDDALPERGLAMGALHEILPASYGDGAAALGFALAVVTRIIRIRPGFVLWASPSHHAFREGALYPVGLAAFGFDPDRLIEARPAKPRDALQALEEGLGEPMLAAVVGVLPGSDQTYGFTASRRLAMRAAESGVTALLVGSGPAPGAATAADTRWSIAAAPSAGERRVGQSMPGLGAPRWRIELTKSKRGAPGRWKVEWNYETFSFRLPAALVDRAAVWARGVEERVVS